MHPVEIFELVFIMLLAILVLHWIALQLKLPPAAAMMAAQKKAVEKLAYDGDGKLVNPQLLERFTRRASMAAHYVGNKTEHRDNINAHYDVILVAVAAGRKELMRLHRAGEIDDESLHSLERDLDVEEIGALDGRV